MKPIYIIIPTYNNMGYLLPCLSSIAENTVEYLRFIVVNNGNKELEDYVKGPKIVYTGKNLGWQGGINAGLEAIDEDCDYVVFMNDDTMILPHHYDWLKKLKDVLDHDESVAAVGPSSNVVMGLQSTGIRHLPAMLETKFLIGFCVMMRKKYFDEIGRMDDTLHGGDDFDWSISFRKKGWKLIARRDVFVFHHGFVTGQKLYGDYWNSPKYCDEVNIGLIRKHGFKAFVETIRGMNEIIPYDLIKEEYGDQNCLLPIVEGKGLDIGCGSSKITPDTIGVDLVAKGVAVGEFGGAASGISNADIKASGDNLHMFEDNSLDYIVARHNIEHYSNPMRTLREWHRVLKPSGKVGITTPDESRINSMFLDMTHKHAFSREMMKDMLEATGFEIEEMGGTANQWDFYVIAKKNGFHNAHICV
jgi:glycosyltransferase involved in cell wall biosynthesis